MCRMRKRVVLPFSVQHLLPTRHREVQPQAFRAGANLALKRENKKSKTSLIDITLFLLISAATRLQSGLSMAIMFFIKTEKRSRFHS